MNTTAKSPPAIPNRPKQDRSKASLDRLLAATRKLMLKRGGEDFTLLEVSKAGRVSTGTIYSRFENKDNLVRAVILQMLKDTEESQRQMVAKLVAQSANLSEFVVKFVEHYVDFLRVNGPQMRLCMARAEHDPLVSEPGKETARRGAAEGANALLSFASEFGGEDCKVKADTCYQIIFASLARHFNIGSSIESRDNDVLELFTEQLSKVCLSYLTGD